MELPERGKVTLGGGDTEQRHPLDKDKLGQAEFMSCKGFAVVVV